MHIMNSLTTLKIINLWVVSVKRRLLMKFLIWERFISVPIVVHRVNNGGQMAVRGIYET